jgi:hypothetical protein
MNPHQIFEEGYNAFKPQINVYDGNPYKKVEEFGPRVDGIPVRSFQIESVPFFNGWEKARKDYNKAETYALFLDDFRFPNWINYIQYPILSSWMIARHYYQFVEIIEKYGIPSLISWDYDLDRHGLEDPGPYKNGLDCVKYLIQYCTKNNLKFPPSVVHSQNPIGGQEIFNFLSNYLQTNK